MSSTTDYNRVDTKINCKTYNFQSGYHLLKHLRDNIAPELVNFKPEKELLDFSEMAPWSDLVMNHNHSYFDGGMV